MERFDCACVSRTYARCKPPTLCLCLSAIERTAFGVRLCSHPYRRVSHSKRNKCVEHDATRAVCIRFRGRAWDAAMSLCVLCVFRCRPHTPVNCRLCSHLHYLVSHSQRNERVDTTPHVRHTHSIPWGSHAMQPRAWVCTRISRCRPHTSFDSRAPPHSHLYHLLSHSQRTECVERDATCEMHTQIRGAAMRCSLQPCVLSLSCIFRHRLRPHCTALH